MKNRRRFVLLICLLAAVGGISGCGKKEAAIDEAVPTAYVPAFSLYEYESPARGYLVWLSKFLQGDRVYAVSREFDTTGGEDYLQIYDLTTGEQSERELGAAGDYFRTSRGYVKYRTNKLVIYDGNFNETDEIDLSGLSNRSESTGIGSACDGIDMDDQGHIGIISGNELVIADREGKLLFSLECPEGVSNFIKLAVTEAGDWYVFCESEAYKIQAYPVDIERQALGGRLEGIPEIYDYLFREAYSVDENGLYIVTGNELYLYDTETSDCKELFCLRDYGVTMDAYSFFGILDSGEPGIVNKLESSEEEVIKLELAVLTEIPAEQIKPRTELVLASLHEPTLEEREPIISFNKYNPDYYVTVKAYAEMDYSTEDWALARQSFVNDLIAGRGADIFLSWRGSIDLETLAEKGALADLYEFMDGDEELKREDFIPSILTAMERDGKLYTMTPMFYLLSIVGKASILDQYSQWDYEAMYDLAAKYPDAVLFPDSSPQKALQTFIFYTGDSFYDMDTGECRFDTPEFIRLLETASSLNTEYNRDTQLAALFHEDKLLLYDTYIATWYDVQKLEKGFGGEAAFVGYPGAGKNGSVISYYYQWAISGQSQNKEGAWAFVKSLFSEEYQSNVMGFPVIRQYFEAMLEEAMSDTVNMRVTVLGADIRLEPMSEEEARILRNLVYSAVLTENYDTTIYNIIMEETEAYFAGQKTAEEVAGIIQTRVQIYVDEKR